MRNTLTTAILLAAGVTALPAQADINDIIISEYVEGSGNNRAIEIANIGDEAYTFDGSYSLYYSSFNNLIQNAAGDDVLQGLTLNPGETAVIINPSQDQGIDTAATANAAAATKTTHVRFSGSFDDVRFNALNFNGDDIVYIGTQGSPLDAVAMNVASADGDPFADQTLRRNSDVCQKASYDSAEWTELASNTFDGLGVYNAGGGCTTPTPTPTVSQLLIEASDYDCADDITDCGPTNGILDFEKTLARYVGQTVELPRDINPLVDGEQNMRVTRSFGFNFSSFRNNIDLSYERVNLHPNQAHAAGSAASAEQNRQNNTRRLVLESASPAPDGEIPYFPDFNDNPNANPVLVNDSVVGLIGRISFSDDEYRITPTQNVTSANFIQNIGRTDEPQLNVTLESDEFELKVASANVLNYFNSPFDGDRNSFGNNRGAASEVEFERQRAKLTESLYRLDADIIGLMEVENNGFSRDGALAQIVDDINQRYFRIDYSGRNRDDSVTNRYNMVGFDTDGNFEINELDTIGTDVITNALIYRPSRVSLKSVDIIEMPSQQAENIVDEDTGEVLTDNAGRLLSSGSARQRNTVVATFVVNNTGKLLTVAVNHFKSKGSNCIDDWENTAKEGEDADYQVVDNDFQGQCEHFRSATSLHLAQEMNDYPGDKIILGDLNSYALEEPMLVLTEIPAGKTVRTAGNTFIGNRPQFANGNRGVELTQGFGYISAVKKQDEQNKRTSFSFSFNDTLGSLDHILVSPSLEDRVKDAIDWNTNSIESPLFDYTEQRRSTSTGRLSPNKGNDPLKFHRDAGGNLELTHYRTSDHDPVIMALGYKYLEAGSDPRRFVINSSRIEVPYVANAEALSGDEIQMSVTPRDHQDMTGVSIASPALSQDGAQSVMVEVNGLENGRYEIAQRTLRNGEVVADSAVTFEAFVSGTDSNTPQIVTPEYDGSGGGGHMTWWTLVLAGLLLGRRQVKA
ncbi:ExeM/NucH family extracellular endonuclease [Bacterioplanoides sp.]|uniref:ExeM/NucH family extracellular endonuclease n=1 Tax=Bacterioplanoides sp. TaxID=2066072 RepID=UPI003B0035BF